MTKLTIWYMTALLSLAFPPLLIVTGIPLVLVAAAQIQGRRQEKREALAVAEWHLREEGWKNARQVRSLLS